jgi:hypothetical protein
MLEDKKLQAQAAYLLRGGIGAGGPPQGTT